MKQAIFLSIVSLACALPQSTPVTGQKLLPWKQPATLTGSIDCGFKKPNSNYKSAFQCFQSHEAEPKLLPWKHAATLLGFIECGFKGGDEEQCGTERYCNLFDTQKSSDYKSAFQCFKAHEEKPKLLPWKQPATLSGAKDCGFKGADEEQCGTGLYCDLFDDQKPNSDYQSAFQCLQAHEPSPV
ncbi:hypothetical protein X797_011781 [Metarhizium robertsii]|uniref:Uncharacterized protein n=1 Tax=Metarhizium robertsii TaxID=568076 RepID=A0A014P1M1_9HYPO|nr:hypothetical protein X797_011781 [Metarhizium robertsii]